MQGNNGSKMPPSPEIPFPGNRLPVQVLILFAVFFPCFYVVVESTVFLYWLSPIIKINHGHFVFSGDKGRKITRIFMQIAQNCVFLRD